MSRWAWSACLIASAAWLGACASSPTGGNPGRSAPAFRAERVSVHPLTRVVRGEDGGFQIEAHFELLDRYGVSVRDLGEVVFEARAGASAGESAPSAVWRKDLRTPEASAAQFDRVTGMYVALLTGAPEGAWSSGRVALTIRFTALDGRVLSATWREGR